MKDNKNQPGKTGANRTYTHHSKTNGSQVLPSARFDHNHSNPPIPSEYNDKIMRRYSFDDNGGGYLGL